MQKESQLKIWCVCVCVINYTISLC